MNFKRWSGSAAKSRRVLLADCWPAEWMLERAARSNTIRDRADRQRTLVFLPSAVPARRLRGHMEVRSDPSGLSGGSVGSAARIGVGGGGGKAATIMVRLSLVFNFGVLITVCTVLIALSTSESVVYCWGPPTAGRGILLSVYASILVCSCALLALHVYAEDKTAVEHMVAALLCTQILYKVTTPLTAGPSNPVAISNLAISVLHAATLVVLWQRYKPLGRTKPTERPTPPDTRI